MGTGRKFHKAPRTRPKKKTGERERRLRTQKKRLVAFGLEEEKVQKMTSREVKDLLKRPKKLQPVEA